MENRIFIIVDNKNNIHSIYTSMRKAKQGMKKANTDEFDSHRKPFKIEQYIPDYYLKTRTE